MTRTILTIVIAAALALPGAAQEPVTRFFIEKIEVRENRRVSTDVIVAESRLREGQEYTEEELSDAANRLNRLPFLLSAEFTLERGYERGRHVLVITVNETRPFFYLLDARPILSESDFSGRNVDIQVGDRLGGGENQGVLGARWFVGRRGAFHAGLFARDDNHEFTRDYTAAVVGYTQYDIFGTRAFATLNLKLPILNAPGAAVVSPQLVAGIPVTPNQTVTVTYDETRFDDYTISFADVEFERQNGERIVSVRWAYDTTNDPFTPTRGTLLSVTPLMVWQDAASYLIVVDRPDELEVRPSAYHTNIYAVSVEVDRYFELSERNSVFAGGEAGIGRVNQRASSVAAEESDGDASFLILKAGYSHSLWSREQQKRGDSRFEYTLRYINRQSPERLFPGPNEEDDQIEAAFAWVRRSSFGTIRLGVGFGW